MISQLLKFLYSLAQLETSADIGTMIGQAISGLFGAITNLISGGLGTAEDSALREELEKTQQELKTWRMITIGVIVVVIVLFLLKKK